MRRSCERARAGTTCRSGGALWQVDYQCLLHAAAASTVAVRPRERAPRASRAGRRRGRQRRNPHRTATAAVRPATPRWSDTGLPVLGHHASEDGIDRLGEFRERLAQRRHGLFDMGQQLVIGGVARVRWTPAQQKVQCAAKAIDVAAVVRCVHVLGLLGADELERAQHFGMPGEALRAAAGTAGREINRASPKSVIRTRPWRSKSKLLGLMSRWHTSCLARITQSIGCLRDQLQCGFESERSLLANETAEVRAVDVLHYKEVNPPVLIGVVSGHDVRMVQFGHQLHFSPELRYRFLTSDERRSEGLQGDEAFHVPVFGFVHDSHPAGPELVEDDALAQHQLLGLPARSKVAW